MKRISMLCAALSCVLGYFATPAAIADEQDKKTVITINARTEAPGIILEPGTYVIKLLNSSSNRHIAEIMNERMDHLYALTFTAAAERLEPTSRTVLTFYEESNGRPQAMKRWFWPGDTIGQEFLYPKNQAERISAATGQKVPEGKLPTLAESGQKLTPDNAQGLILETSQKTEDSSTVPERAEPTTTAQNTVVIAQNTAPPPAVDRDADDKKTTVDTDDKSAANTNNSITSVAPVPDTKPADNAPVLSASNDSSDKALPQTASQLPLIAGVGMISLALAAFMGFLRRNSTDSL